MIDTSGTFEWMLRELASFALHIGMADTVALRDPRDDHVDTIQTGTTRLGFIQLEFPVALVESGARAEELRRWIRTQALTAGNPCAVGM